MKKNIILVRDDEDFDYIYGVIILKGNILDTRLLQKRLDNMRKILYEKVENGEYDNIDFNGDDIVKKVLKENEEYKDLEYISFGNEYLEI